MKIPFQVIEETKPPEMSLAMQKEMAEDFERLRNGKTTALEDLILQLEPESLDGENWSIVYEDTRAVYLSGFTSEQACWDHIRGIKIL